jgi:hypothetical protein
MKSKNASRRIDSAQRLLAREYGKHLTQPIQDARRQSEKVVVVRGGASALFVTVSK